MESIVIGVVALLAGLAIGWLLGGRAAQTLRAEHAASVAQGEMLRGLRESLEVERDNAVGECGSLRVKIAELSARTEEQAAQASRERTALHEQFKLVAQATLDEAQAKFLERANQRFNESEQASKQSLGALLQPVHDRLQKYETAVGNIEAERREAFAGLSSQIETMRIDAGRVASGADNIVSALRHAPKARGNWGEQQLRNVLETCGLTEHTDFDVEVSATVGGARLRPDALIRVPGGKSLIIDAKVSFNAYQDAIGAVDEIERLAAFKRHAASMRAHVDSLNFKDYARAFEGTPDYVIMFVGGEHFLSAALEYDPRLWDDAWNKRVLIATPTNLVAVARTISAVWRQEKLATQAREIAMLGKHMYDRLAIVGERLGKAGAGLNRAVDSFNEATKTFNGDLAVTGRRFKELNVEVGTRVLDDVDSVDKIATHADRVIALQESTDSAQD